MSDDAVVMTDKDGLPDLRTMFPKKSIGAVFLFLVRQYLKAGRLVGAISGWGFDPGSPVIGIEFSCDCVSVRLGVDLGRPITDLIDVHADIDKLRIMAHRLVDVQLEQAFVQAAQQMPQVYLKTFLDGIPLEEIDAYYKEKAAGKAVAMQP